MTDEQKAPAYPKGSLFASVRNDITIPYYTDVLDFLDDTLIQRGGGQGLKIYDEIERDLHAYSVLTKRRQKLIGREWIVKPGGADKADIEAADYMRDVLMNMGFDVLCNGLLGATLKGFSVAEMTYVPDGRHIMVQSHKDQDQRRFVFDAKFKPRLLTREAPVKGVRMPERKFVVHRFGMKGNNPYGLGMGSRLFWPVLFKRKGVAFWMRFLEKFATPIPVGKYPLGSLPEQQRELMNVLEGMNQASAITVPYGTELETFEGKRSGTVDHEGWQKFWNGEISKATLGETLTTETGPNGARAMGEVHHDMLDALVDHDADLLSDTLNRGLVQWLTSWSYPTAKPPNIWRPRPTNEQEEEALETKRAERRSKQIKALEDARAQGYEPEDVDAYMAGVFDGPVRKIPPQAQKKTPVR